jgi:hypothetical protein
VLGLLFPVFARGSICEKVSADTDPGCESDLPAVKVRDLEAPRSAPSVLANLRSAFGLRLRREPIAGARRF